MTEHTRATRANLDLALKTVPAYLHPILQAVRDHGVGMMFVPQVTEPFRLPRDHKRPAIIIIGDDFDCAVGPDGFHLPSIRRAIRACQAFAVVSSAPPPAVYLTVAVGAAALRQSAMLIETRPEQEIQWVSLIQKLAPGRFIQLATVEGSRN